MSISEAVVLAAGEGRRLRPLTTYQPKPMLPVANRPIIEYVIDALLEAGIDRIAVVVGYRSERIQSHLTKRYPELDLTFVPQRTRLGSGHALQQASDVVGDVFAVVNGDNVIDAETVSAAVERYESTDSVATVAVTHSETPEDYGVVRVDRGLIADIDEHPTTRDGYLVNAGVYAFGRSVFDALSDTETRDGELQLPDAIAALVGPVSSVYVEGWMDPSTPWSLLSVTEHVLADRTEPAIDPDARIHESAVVEPGVVVGADCVVGPNAVLGRGTCLQENVRVGANSVVERTVVSTDARIGCGVVVRDSIVGVGARIGDGVVSPGGRADAVVDNRFYRDVTVGCVIADRARVGANVTLVAGSQIGAEATVGDGVVLQRSVNERAEVTC